MNALKRSYISYDRGSKMMKITDYRGAVLQTSLYNYVNVRYRPDLHANYVIVMYIDDSLCLRKWIMHKEHPYR